MNKESLRHRSGIGLLFLVFLMVSLIILGIVFKARQEEATLAVKTQEAVVVTIEPNTSFQNSSSCSSYHIARSGDTLATIALTYDVSLPALVEANGIGNSGLTGLGQRLCIPGPQPIPTSTAAASSPVQPTPVPISSEQTALPSVSNSGTYTVQPDDTLSAIALAFDVSVNALMEINGITDARTVQVGQKLQIPGSSTTVLSVPAPVVSSPVEIATPIPTSDLFAVQFFNNMTLSGSPVFVKTDPVGWSYDWGLNAPATGVNRDFFSASWDGSFTFPAGTHRFTVVADDGIRLHVDDDLVMALWYDQAADTTHTVDVALTEGTHRVRLEYYDRSENASVRMSWQLLTAEVYDSGTEQVSVAQPILTSEVSSDLRKGSEGEVWAALLEKDPASLRTAIQGLPHLNFRNNWGGTPLHLAVNQAVNVEFAEMLSILLEHPSANIEAVMDDEFEDITDITPLHRAANFERLIAIEILLQHGADLEARDSQNRTPLLTAVAGLHDEATELLLSLGANPNVQIELPGKIRNGYTPVHMAVSRYEDTDPLRKILAHPGINPNIRDARGNTALFKATVEDDIEKVRILLRHPDVNPNRTGENGRTPLHIAVIYQFTEVFRALLAHPDIDPNVQDDEGRTPLQEAIRRSPTEFRDELRDHPDTDLP